MITTANVYTVLFLHLGIILVVTAYYALSAAMAPRLVERARLRFARRPWLPALVGVGLSVPWVFASVVMLSQTPAGAKFAGAVLGCAWILCGLIGGAAIAQHVGRPRVSAMAGGDSAALRDSGAWTDAVRGGLLLSLTWVLPLVGWLGILPLTLAAGLGCLVMGVIPMRAPAPPAAAVVPAM